MEGFNLKEIFNRAIAKEEEASSLYQDLSRRVEDQGARVLLKKLSSEELKHKEKLKEIQKIKPDTISQARKIEDPRITDFLAKSSLDKYSSVQNVLQSAIKEESDAQNFYLSWAESTLEENIAVLLKELADEELKHKVKLEKMYEDLFLKEN